MQYFLLFCLLILVGGTTKKPQRLSVSFAEPPEKTMLRSAPSGRYERLISENAQSNVLARMNDILYLYGFQATRGVETNLKMGLLSFCMMATDAYTVIPSEVDDSSSLPDREIGMAKIIFKALFEEDSERRTIRLDEEDLNEFCNSQISENLTPLGLEFLQKYC